MGGKNRLKLCDMPAHALAGLLARREISAVEVTEAVLSRVRMREDELHCYLTLDADGALTAAKEIDRRRLSGENLRPLAGIPLAVSDNICTEGLKTTCASRMLADFVPPYQATAVTRLQGAGAIVVGKTNLDEFGLGVSTENSAFGPTKNPWRLGHAPGGAGGGAAAAVASGEAVLALGSDTGGTLRQPASWCGLVGLKPTYGRVSRFGLVAYASSMDQIGLLTRDVHDSALAMNLLVGADELDPTALADQVPDYEQALQRGVKGLIVGLPSEYLSGTADPEVAACVRGAVSKLEGLGARVEELAMPLSEQALAAYSVIAAAECSSSLARLDGVRYGYRSQVAPDTVTMFSQTRAEGFGQGAKLGILMGTLVLSAGYFERYYLQAAKVRTLIKEEFAAAFAKCDLLVTPTVPTVATPLGENTDGPSSMHPSHRYTAAASLTGLPALSLPCGFVAGLPVGLQLIGPALQEERLLAAAYALEEAVGLAPLQPGKEARQ